MKNFFGLGLTSKKGIKGKLAKYFTKEFASDLLRIHSEMMLFYKADEGWIGANDLFFEKMKFEDMEEFSQYHSSIRDLFYTQSENILSDDDTRWLEYIRTKKNGTFKVTIRVDSKVRFYRIYVEKSYHFDDLYIVELKDVTQEELSYRQQKELKYLKSTFLANISHEFRTPMNGIMGFLELLSHTELDKLQKSYLRMLERSSEALLNNVEALLDLSQLQSGEITVQSGFVNMLPRFERAVKHFSYFAQESKKHFFAFIDPALPLEIFTDEKKITQILHSVIQHAFEYTQKGDRIFLEIKTVRFGENGECEVLFRLRHNGRGLSAEEMASLQRPFEGDANHVLGISLLLANQFANLLGLKLDIKSDPFAGSEFQFVLKTKYIKERKYGQTKKHKATIVLPESASEDRFKVLARYLKAFGLGVAKVSKPQRSLCQKSDIVYLMTPADEKVTEEFWRTCKGRSLVYVSPLGATTPKKTLAMFSANLEEPFVPSSIFAHLLELEAKVQNGTVVSQTGLVKQLHALVVEDNLINQKLLDLILKNKRIATTIASDGAEAVQKAKKERFDIIFMDIDMPKMDGVVATKHIKTSDGPNKNTPIVALTARALAGDKERLLAAGLDDYMAKPLQRERLEEVLYHFFGSKE